MATNFTLNKQFWILGPNLLRKSIFGQKQESEHIRISLGSKFQFKLTILNFGTKFAQKEYFWPEKKKKKVKISIEFCIFELVHSHFPNILRFFDVLPNFSFTNSEAMLDYCL